MTLLLLLRGTTTIGKDSQAVWNTRALVNKDSQEVWNARALVAKNSQEVWNARALVNKDSQEVWNARALVAKDSQEVWSARALVAKNSQTIWNARALVNKDSQEVWNTRALVAKNSQEVWNARALVNKDSQEVWNARALVSKNSQQVWNVYTFVGKSVDYLWNVAEVVGGIVGEERQFLWRVRSLTTKSLVYRWNVKKFSPYFVQEPDFVFQEALLSGTTLATRRIDVYESDGSTLWQQNVKGIGGNITVDQSRAERRAVDLALDNYDGQLRHDTDHFWYDKIIKTYAGVLTNYGAWEVQTGEFMIDSIDSQHHPHTIQITGRDYTKKLQNSKFGAATTFLAGTSLEKIVRALAVNGGVTRLYIPATSRTLDVDVTFEANSSRWDAIASLGTAYGFEAFFTATGVFTFREYQDPVVSPEVFTFQTGAESNISTIGKRCGDARLFNHVKVTGGSASTATVVADAINDDPFSPTSTVRIGERVYSYESQLITDYWQALDVARKFLRIMALEEYEVNLDTLFLPWLDVGQIVKVLDPDADEDQPTKFLLSTMSLPLQLAAMQVTAKRVVIVNG